jgi:tetratricopeptide (TPR) repeat protein
LQPALAAQQAAGVLRSTPDHPLATLFLGVAERQLGNVDRALRILEPLARTHAGWAAAHYELGIALGLLGRREAALQSLQHAVRLKANIGEAWRLIAEHLMETGDPAGADAAYANHRAVEGCDPGLLAPATALCDNRLSDAETLLRAHLERIPGDAAALRMLAEVAMRRRRYADAEELLRRCLELEPDSTAARHSYAMVLYELNRTKAALTETDRLLAVDPWNMAYLNLKANVLAQAGDHENAIGAYAVVLAACPGNARIWVSYGDALKTAGRQAECIAAYRRGIELAPGFGEAWWSLANLKTFRFSTDEVAAMRAQIGRTDITGDDRLHFHFALGKALEDDRQYADSFKHYAAGNRIRREGVVYDAEATSVYVRRCKALYTAHFIAERRAWGCPAGDPIFVVGLPRAGSTLVEQILSSHSAVEGTMELPDVIGIARSLVPSGGKSQPPYYPEVLATLGAGQFRALGERYLHQTRARRRAGSPFFIDKMPNNWMHVGLIHLMLPNAKIIDARRHPMGCCFSAFKQHFARGQLYTYSLEDLGRYYRDYADLLAHFDAMLPGRIHRVHYERLIEDTETEVRHLLAYCGLPFEDQCLRFHESARAVSTASSEQVRRPIFREALDQWRHYEEWLQPLKQALGPLLAAHPV